ncbi:hypothetical protein TNCV_113921 [Trichonephila clavipes]|nr:hypothetical protein TNCV_113921 [Trichonephila clavipes]
MDEYDWNGLRCHLTLIPVWDVSGSSIAARRPAPTTINELKSALVQEWVLLPKGLIRTQVNSMKYRRESCVAVRNGNTPN